MTNPVTIEQVESLAGQLPPQEQLRLIAWISERLSAALPVPSPTADEAELQRQREGEADELLARLDAAAELCEGEFDSAEEIRQMRAERDEQIWPSK